MKNNNNIIIERTDVICRNVKPGLNANKASAELYEEVTRTYPAAQGKTSLSDGLFDSEAFGKGTTYPAQKRVAFLDVPKDSTMEQVQAKVDNFPEACIYNIYSTDVMDVLHEDQIRSLDNPDFDMTVEKFQDKHIVRESKNGPVVMHNDKPLYSSSHFSQVAKADVDYRDAVVSDELTANSRANWVENDEKANVTVKEEVKTDSNM